MPRLRLAISAVVRRAPTKSGTATQFTGVRWLSPNYSPVSTIIRGGGKTQQTNTEGKRTKVKGQSRGQGPGTRSGLEKPIVDMRGATGDAGGSGTVTEFMEFGACPRPTAQAADIARERTRPRQSPSARAVIPANAGIQERREEGSRPHWALGRAGRYPVSAACR